MKVKSNIVPYICIGGILIAILVVVLVFSDTYFINSSPNLVTEPTSVVESGLISEELGSIPDTVSFAYLVSNAKDKTLKYKRLKAGEKTIEDFTLPFDENFDYSSMYRFSPSGQYIAHILDKTVEIAELKDGVVGDFKSVYKSPSHIAEGPVGGQIDYSNIGDALWDSRGGLYFINQVGIDGASSPYGNYTEIFSAQEDGSNARKVFSSESLKGVYLYNRTFSAIDPVTQTIYLTGITHSGHTAPLVSLQLKNGKLQTYENGIGYDEPYFSKDFSKAFFSMDREESGADDILHTKLFVYEPEVKKRKLLFEVSSSGEIRSKPIYSEANKKVYFAAYEDSKNTVYEIAEGSGMNPKKLMTGDNCTPEFASSNGAYLLLDCYYKNYSTLEIYDTQTGSRSVFSKRSHDIDIRLVKFE